MHQVKHEIDRDLLGTKKPNWDQSVGIIGNEKAEEHSKAVEVLEKSLSEAQNSLQRSQSSEKGLQAQIEALKSDSSQ